MKPAWHELLAPLPGDAAVRRKPVSDRLPGWESLSVELSAGAAGLRHLLVTLENGTPISAGDWVVYRSESGGEVTWEHESVGGRLEADGRFLGTRWRTVAVGAADSDEAETRESVPSAPSEADVIALRALVREIVERAGRDSR